MLSSALATELMKETIISPLITKSFYLNIHPLEVVSRYRDPQL